MRIHRSFLSIETLLEGQEKCTPKQLGLTLPADWDLIHASGCRLRTALVEEVDSLSPTAGATHELIKNLMQCKEPLFLIRQDLQRSAEGDENAAQNRPQVGLSHHGAHGGLVHQYHLKYNDIWLRDTGPLFLMAKDHGKPRRGGVLLFRFNAWGKKYPYNHDGRFSHRLIEKLCAEGDLAGYDDFYIFTTDFVCEGGSLESNGRGIILTTRSATLHPNRGNLWRDMLCSRENVTVILKELLGAEKVIFLAGGLPDDDTDGHIDNVCRFVDRTRVLVAAAPLEGARKGGEDNFLATAKEQELQKTLLANHEQLTKEREKSGIGYFEIVSLPLPPPRYASGEAIMRMKGGAEIKLLSKQVASAPSLTQLPTSPLNYLRLPGKIIFPSSNKAYEKDVLPKLRAIFSDEKFIWIDWRAAISEGGGPHCLSLPVPDFPKA